MLKILKTELNNFHNELKTLDRKVSIIFLSSSILFILSWYFANPRFFIETFTFNDPPTQIIKDLISFAYWFLLDFMLYLIIPVYIIKLIFKESLHKYGLTIGEKSIGLFYLILSLIIVLPIIYFAYNSADFNNYFPLMQSAKNDIKIFLLYEILFLIFIFSWEFIFRGFILFGLEKKFGIYAIFIQMIPFTILHFDKPFIETVSSIIGGIFLGYLAIRTRSIFYGFIIHSIILISLDILSYIGI